MSQPPPPIWGEPDWTPFGNPGAPEVGPPRYPDPVKVVAIQSAAIFLNRPGWEIPQLLKAADQIEEWLRS